MTGQAFEDMQEQNIRLMQQLREKDDANFKLMSERIKSNQIHKLLKEEKEELADQLLTLKTQVSHKTKHEQLVQTHYTLLKCPKPDRFSKTAISNRTVKGCKWSCMWSSIFIVL